MATKTNNKSRKPQAKQKTGDIIRVSNIEQGSVAAVGRGSKAVVVNIFGGNWKFFSVILALCVLGGLGYFAWKRLNPEKMTGSFRIAIAEFGVIGNPDASDIGFELSNSVYRKIKDSFSEVQTDYDITIWGPEKVGKVIGDTPEERSASARRIAEGIDANIVVYGFVDATESTWQIFPEFYVASFNSYQIDEITGQYQLGQPFTLVGQENAVRRLEINSKFNIRTQGLSQVVIGLFYYSIHEYQIALDMFITAEGIDGWDDDQGKQVLYLLMGNAASKSKNLDAALGYLEKSLGIDPDYARPLVTIAGVYYLKALGTFDVSKDPGDIDQELLGKAEAIYQEALRAKNQPPLSDISEKVHFGLGQVYFMQAYGGKEVDIQKAVDEFQYVITEFGDGENPRIRELAAESHARMGLIYEFSGYPEDAAREYQIAADLLFDYPDEQQKYQKRADELSGKISTP